MAILIPLMVLLEGCFGSIFERIETKDGKVKATVTVNPGRSTDHVFITRGHKWFNTTPKDDFAHVTDHFFIHERDGSLRVVYLGALLEDKFQNKEDIQLIWARSYDNLSAHFQQVEKEDILFNFSDLE